MRLIVLCRLQTVKLGVRFLDRYNIRAEYKAYIYIYVYIYIDRCRQARLEMAPLQSVFDENTELLSIPVVCIFTFMLQGCALYICASALHVRTLVLWSSALRVQGKPRLYYIMNAS